MKQIVLNNGQEIDIIGSGTNTFGKENREYRGAITGDTTEILSAIEIGYRHFDTAISYRNEAVLARAIKQSGIHRLNFFITSKIPTTEEVLRDIEGTIEKSLEALETTMIDLFLIHHPSDNEANLKVWKVLEEYHQKGVLKSIGVSNFSVEQIKYLNDNSKTQVAVNQIESHPGKWQDELIKACQEMGIAIEAWGPLTQVSEEAKKVLTDIGAKYGKTWAQVILNYQVNRDVIVIPKSHNAERQALNLDVFDFQLSDEEKEIIKSL